MANVNLYYGQYRNIVRQDTDLIIPREIRAFGYYGIYSSAIKSILLQESNGIYWYRLYYSRSAEVLPPVYSGSLKQNVSADYFDLKKFPDPKSAWNNLKQEILLNYGSLPYIDTR